MSRSIAAAPRPATPARLALAGILPRVVFLGLWLLAGLLFAVVLARLGWSIATIAAPGEVEFGEALIHNHAARIVGGAALYQSVYQPAFTVASYTPLYYAACAVLQLVFGPGLVFGRGLSLTAGLVAACLVGWLAVRRADGWRAGILAALLFVGLGLPGQHPWWALYKEDMLGVALALASVAALSSGPTRRRVFLGATLAALAVLTKQTLVAAGLAGFVWLILRRDWRAAVGFAATGLLLAAGVILALELTTHGFLANVVQANANPLRVQALVENLNFYARFQAGLLLVAALGIAWPGRRSLASARPHGVDLVVLYWLAACLVPLVGLAKLGSFHNYWLELAAATAVLAAAGLTARVHAALAHGADIRCWAAALACTLAIAANGAWVLRASDIPALVQHGVLPPPAEVAAFKSLVQRVRSEPRQVVADPPDVVALAGRPILFEPWAMSLLYSQGLWGWQPGPLTRQICDGGVGLVVLGYPLETNGPEMQGMSRWAPPLIAALRSVMVLEGEQAQRFVYVPRPAAPTGNTGCGSAV